MGARATAPVPMAKVVGWLTMRFSSSLYRVLRFARMLSMDIRGIDEEVIWTRFERCCGRMDIYFIYSRSAYRSALIRSVLTRIMSNILSLPQPAVACVMSVAWSTEGENVRLLSKGSIMDHKWKRYLKSLSGPPFWSHFGKPLHSKIILILTGSIVWFTKRLTSVPKDMTYYCST